MPTQSRPQKASRPQAPSTAQDRQQTRPSDNPQSWAVDQNSNSQTDLLQHPYDTHSWYTSCNRGYIASSDSSESDHNQSARGGSPVELDFVDLSLDFGQEFATDFDFLSAESSTYAYKPFAFDPLLVDQEYNLAMPSMQNQYDAPECTAPVEGLPEMTSSNLLLQDDSGDPEEVVMRMPTSCEETQSVVSTVTLYPSPWFNLLPPIDRFAMTSDWLANESAQDGFGDNRTCWPWHLLSSTGMGCSKKEKRLLEVAMVACCGVLAGQMRSDTDLLNTAQEAYHLTVRRLRKRLGDVEGSDNSHIKRNAMILVTATWAVMVEKVSS